MCIFSKFSKRPPFYPPAFFSSSTGWQNRIRHVPGGHPRPLPSPFLHRFDQNRCRPHHFDQNRCPPHHFVQTAGGCGGWWGLGIIRYVEFENLISGPPCTGLCKTTCRRCPSPHFPLYLFSSPPSPSLCPPFFSEGVVSLRFSDFP